MYAFLDDDQVDGYLERTLEELNWGAMGKVCLNTDCDSHNDQKYYHKDKKLCPCCKHELAIHDLTAEEYLEDTEALIEHTYINNECTGGILHMPYPITVDLNMGAVIAEYKTKRVVKPIQQDWMHVHAYVKALGSKSGKIKSLGEIIKGEAA